MQQVLEPLLEDFQHWFTQARTLLADDAVETVLTADERADLQARIHAAQQQVNTAHTLLRATTGQAGVDTQMVQAWHHLVTEYWRVAIAVRQAQKGA